MKKIFILIIPTALIMVTLYFMLDNFKVTYTPPIEEIVEAEIIPEEVEAKTIEYNKPNIESYHKDLDEIAKTNSVCGMQVVVFKGEDILDSYNYGYSDIKRTKKVDDKTVFRIASTSKMISNILIMKLVDDGKINLNSNLKEVTGLDFDDDVKLYQILTHTSGIIDSEIFNDNLDKVYDINYLLKISSRNKPGSEYYYSNFASGTMAAIVEKLTGEYFYDYAKNELFDKLNLNAAYVCEYLDENSDIAEMDDEGVVNPKTWKYNLDFYKQFELGKQYRLAYGNLFTSASDLSKLGMVLAGNGMYDGQIILSANALNEIRTIRNEALGYKYLMGLNTDYFDDLIEGRRIYGHTGSAYNAVSYLMYDPNDSTGVAFVSNFSFLNKNDKGYSKIIYDIMNLAYKDFFTISNKQ